MDLSKYIINKINYLLTFENGPLFFKIEDNKLYITSNCKIKKNNIIGNDYSLLDKEIFILHNIIKKKYVNKFYEETYKSKIEIFVL